MNKEIIKYVFLFAILFLVFAPTILADDETTGNNSSNETMDDDVAAFQSSWGAKVRLLQLEKSITKNILWGTEIVTAIKNLNETADTGDLEAILAELELLKQEVSSTEPISGEAGAQMFVDMKRDAINLTKQFRTIVMSMLHPGDVNGLRKRLGQLEYNETKNLRERIREAVREYNAEEINELLEVIGVNNTALMERIRTGNATKKEVKDVLNDAIKNLTKTRKTQVSLTMGERRQEAKVFAKSVTKRVQNGQQERVQERVEKRIEKAKSMNIDDELVNRMQCPKGGWRIKWSEKQF